MQSSCGPPFLRPPETCLWILWARLRAKIDPKPKEPKKRKSKSAPAAGSGDTAHFDWGVIKAVRPRAQLYCGKKRNDLEVSPCPLEGCGLHFAGALHAMSHHISHERASKHHGTCYKQPTLDE